MNGVKLIQSESCVPRLEVRERTGSTNDDLVLAASGVASDSWPDFSVIVTDNQTSGRGRLDRVWSAEPGTSLAISVLLRPHPALPMESMGWLPLLAGLAMSRAITSFGPLATVKWPNDVHIDGKKVCGILCELLPQADGVVVGAGLNLLMSAAQLPTPTATSLFLETSADIDPDTILAAYLSQLRELYDRYQDAGGDPNASGLRDEVRDACSSLGKTVRVELPNGETIVGTATEIDENGRLVVESNGRLTTVAAGDVTHLRY